MKHYAHEVEPNQADRAEDRRLERTEEEAEVAHLRCRHPLDLATRQLEEARRRLERAKDELQQEADSHQPRRHITRIERAVLSVERCLRASAEARGLMASAEVVTESMTEEGQWR